MEEKKPDPIPNTQSPIPNPHFESILKIFLNKY